MSRVSLGLALFGVLESASAGAEATSFNPVKNVEVMLEVSGSKSDGSSRCSRVANHRLFR